MRMRCNYFLITAEICHIWTASYLWEYPRAFCIFLDVYKKWSHGICHGRCDMENGGVEGLSLNEWLRSRACRMYPVWWCNRAGKRCLPAYILVCSPVALTMCPRPHPSHLSVFTPEIFISRAPPWLISLLDYFSQSSVSSAPFILSFTLAFVLPQVQENIPNDTKSKCVLITSAKC